MLSIIFSFLSFISPILSVFSSFFISSSVFFFALSFPSQLSSFSRVYEKIMEHLQERGSSVSGFKRVISTWAKKKGLKGNENRQKK